MARHVILIVLDGLRPDFVNDALTPHIAALAPAGVAFARHHAVFPSVTRVNSASIATGCHPANHGLVDNTLYLPDLLPDPIDTGDHQALRAIDRATDGRLLDTPSLTEILGSAGLRVAVATTCTTGACFLQNPRGHGLTVNPGFISPETPEIPTRFGVCPPKRRPAAEANAWVTGIATEYVWKERRPDLMIVWFCDPDHTQHGFGLGSPESRQAIRAADACVGQVIRTAHDSGADDTDILVVSDHGWVSHRAPLPVGKALIAAGIKPSSESREVVVAGQGVYLASDAGVSGRDVVTVLQGVDGMGALFTREGGFGTFPLAAVSCGHSRSPDVLFASAWDAAVNAHGVPGMALGGGAGGHGGGSVHEMHATAIAAGPDFRRGVVSRVPTGQVDLLPTILHLLGQPPAPGKDGRVLLEALADGVSEREVEVREEVMTVEEGGYRTALHRSYAGGSMYVDRANRGEER